MEAIRTSGTRPSETRLKLTVRGMVQGVGFRPFVHRMAHELCLTGYVKNTPEGVEIEIEGGRDKIDLFVLALRKQAPPLAKIFSIDQDLLKPNGGDDFSIVESESRGAKTGGILPDMGTCADCLADIRDPDNRRYRYPFTNCTNCGPRYTIIETLPYDRPNTTMARFAMCPACRREYDDPLSRRFHAQPNACPECGPRLAWNLADGRRVAAGEDALAACEKMIRDGGIVAMKGLGGFHLMCDARNDAAVRRMRERKERNAKPFAILFPAPPDDPLRFVRAFAEPPPEEAAILVSAERPIVLIRQSRRVGSGDPLATSVAPGLKTVGAFLPYTPLHHLLTADLGFPVVATSANRSDDPIVTTADEIVHDLSGVADAILDHDRPIRRRCDDSVTRVIGSKAVPFRRSRGYAPMPVRLAHPLKAGVLAVGGHQKVTIAIGRGDEVLLSQHLGDMDTPKAASFFDETVRDVMRLSDFQPEIIAHDLHPGYWTTRWAVASGLPHIGVQHHHAHVASCMAELGWTGTVIGVAWDGTGYGLDRTIWGGEFFVGDENELDRVASLRPFPLLGGERAVREPRRVALSLLLETYGIEGVERLGRLRGAFTDRELDLLVGAWEKKINAPVTTSAGRLFDGIAALAGVCSRASYEAEAAMRLEQECDPRADGLYDLPVVLDAAIAPDRLILDWRALIAAVVDDAARGIDAGRVARRFHDSLAEAIAVTAGILREDGGSSRVVLSGGVFQNARLSAETSARLIARGFEVGTHAQVPPNDGGLALGQAVMAGGLLCG